MIRVLRALGLLSLLATPAFAGDAYSFKVERQGDIRKIERKGRILVEGRSYRLEIDPNPKDDLRAYDVLISRDGGGTETALDLGRRTYYTPKHNDLAASDSLFVLFGGSTPKERSAKNVHLETTDSPETETLGGVTAHRHEIKLSYDIEIKYPSEIVKGTVHMEARYWMTGMTGTTGSAPVLLPRMVRPDLRTSFPEIDARLAEALAQLPGLPVKQEIVINSDVAQGVSQESHTLITLKSRSKTATQPSRFAVPAGFKFKEPVFSGPGLSKPQR
jgi:hypothetical protein